MRETTRAQRPALRLAVAQPAIVPGDLPANVAAHAAVVLATRATVVVFPEMSLTGYHLDAAAVSIDDPVLGPLVAACAATGTTALAGAPVSDGGGTDFIAVLAVDGTGVTIAYRKMWPGAEEARRFTAGPCPAAVTIAGWRLGLAICRDTGIRAHQQQTAALRIDAYVGGTVMLPQERVEQDRRGSSIAAALAIPVALASFAGPTGAGYDRTAGCSAIWSPAGALLVQLGPETDVVATAVLH